MSKKFTGKIVSLKIKGAATVAVERIFRHPEYHKVVRRQTKYLSDTKGFEDLKLGDSVEIEETRPMSKRKFFKVYKKI